MRTQKIRMTSTRGMSNPGFAARFTTLAIASLGLLGGSHFADAKTPGHTYCFYGTCHRVKSLAETQALVGKVDTLKASFYDSCKLDRYNPCGLTSSGEVFRPDAADNAASPVYPDGTMLLVWSPESKESVVVRVNNAGPYWGDRKLDLSRAAAERLGFKGRGVASLKVRVISAPGKADATYKKNRVYDPVPGYIGQYASLEDAHTGMTAVLALSAIASSLLAPAAGSIVTAARTEQQGSMPVMVASAETPEIGTEVVAEMERVASILSEREKAAEAKLAATKAAEAKRVAMAAKATPARAGVKAKLPPPGDLNPLEVADKLLRTAAFMITGQDVPAERTRASGRSQVQAKVRKAEPVRVAAREASAKKRSTREAYRQAREERTVRASKPQEGTKAVRKVAAVSAKPMRKTAVSVAVASAPNDHSMFSRHAPKPQDLAAPKPVKAVAALKKAAPRAGVKPQGGSGKVASKPRGGTLKESALRYSAKPQV